MIMISKRERKGYDDYTKKLRLLLLFPFTLGIKNRGNVQSCFTLYTLWFVGNGGGCAAYGDKGT